MKVARVLVTSMILICSFAEAQELSDELLTWFLSVNRWVSDQTAANHIIAIQQTSKELVAIEDFSGDNLQTLQDLSERYFDLMDTGLSLLDEIADELITDTSSETRALALAGDAYRTALDSGYEIHRQLSGDGLDSGEFNLINSTTALATSVGRLWVDNYFSN